MVLGTSLLSSGRNEIVHTAVTYCPVAAGQDWSGLSKALALTPTHQPEGWSHPPGAWAPATSTHTMQANFFWKSCGIGVAIGPSIRQDFMRVAFDRGGALNDADATATRLLRSCDPDRT